MRFHSSVGMGQLLDFRAVGDTDIRKIHSLHSSFLISQTTIVVFKINSSFIFFSKLLFDNFETT